MSDLDRRPHTLHLTLDKLGWITWTLDCPYSATEVEDVPGRPCNLLTENTEPRPDVDDPEDAFWSPWVPTPGCFAKQYLDETGWEDAVCLDRTDPSFPLEVDIEIDGYGDDAVVRAIRPWKEVRP